MSKTMTHTTATINGTRFIIDRIAAKKFGARIAAYDLEDAYARPSYRKINIWADWRKELTGPVWISSYNSMMFTIAGKTTDETTGQEYFVFITPTYNYAWPVEA